MLYFICEMLLKVNYFAAGESKGLISISFIKAEMIVFCVYAVFHTIYFQMIFYQGLPCNSFSVNFSSVICKSADVIQ